MAAILAQVHGDAVGTGLLRQQRGVHRIRVLGAARLAHRGDVIDVDAQTDVRMIHGRTAEDFNVL